MPSPSAHTDSTWIVIGDIHDKLDRLDDIPELPEADGVIISGDLTILGGMAQARRIIERIRERTPRVLAQIGNMDRGEISEWLDEMGWNLHTHVRELTPDTAIMGLGGSTFTPFGTPSEFPEARFADWLENMWREARTWRRVILVSHTPPLDTACDKISDGRHVGSSAVREFLEDCQPDACLCGHIHEARAVDRLGRTIVANPGALDDGGYLVLHLGGEELSVTRHLLPPRPPEA